MSAPLLLDLSHTSHTRARTGIQRVTRSLHEALGTRACAITHDPHAGLWRELEPWETANLGAGGAAETRGARWSLSARLRGRLRRLRGGAPVPAIAARASGLVVPDVFSPVVAAALPALFAAVRGPRVALFHDALALQFPELSPTRTVARFPGYLRELLGFDGIAAVSEDSRQALVDYWSWLGVADPPPIAAIPLGIPPRPPAAPAPADDAAAAVPEVLSVGSIEGRKNHLALLEAAEQLWAGGETFVLRLIGLAHPQTGSAALARLGALQAAGRPVRYDGPVDDAALKAAYRASAFTVYPSLREGFGLPVLESLAHGRPCICSARGALGESARGGGCLTLDEVDAPALAAAMRTLLRSPERRQALAAAAARRTFPSPADHAASLVEWLATVPRRS